MDKMLFKQLWQRFINLINHFLQKKTNYNNDLLFFENDENLYNVDGTLTQHYRDKIKEYEKYLLNNPISTFLINNESTDNTDIAVIQSIKDFTEKRVEIMNEYDNENREKGSIFSPISFIKERSMQSVECMKEKEDISHTIDAIIEDDALDIVATPEVRIFFSQTINENKL